MVDATNDDEDRFSELHARWIRGKNSSQLENELGRCKRGRWTADELALLKNNVDEFVKDHDIQNLDHFIFSRKRRERQSFYKSIAKGIQRPIFTVYIKVIHLYNLRNYVGQWSRELEQELLRLHSLHGNQWTVIGQQLGVSGRAAQDKYRELKGRERKGRWSVREEERLSEAIITHGDSSWATIAQEVGTRSALQCRRKWVDNLEWTQAGGERQWDECDDVQLLHILSSLGAECEDEVDWSALCRGWEAARSASYLRTKWASLRRAVPRYKISTYTDNLDYLMEHRLPALERTVEQKFMVTN